MTLNKIKVLTVIFRKRENSTMESDGDKKLP